MATHNYTNYLTYTPIRSTYSYKTTDGANYIIKVAPSTVTGQAIINLQDLYASTTVNSINKITLTWSPSIGGFSWTNNAIAMVNGVSAWNRRAEIENPTIVDNKITIPVSIIANSLPNSVSREYLENYVDTASLQGFVSLYLSSFKAIIEYDGTNPPSIEAKAEICIDSEMRPIGKIWIGDSANNPHLAKKIWIGTPDGNKLIWPPQTLGNQDLGALIYLKEDASNYTAWRIVARNCYNVDEEGTRPSYTTVLMRETLMSGYGAYSSSTSNPYYRNQTLDQKVSGFYDGTATTHVTNGVLQDLIQPVYILSGVNKPATKGDDGNWYQSLTPNRILRYSFAPSYSELKGGTLASLEGEQFPYFAGKENSVFIRKLSGTAQQYLTRSASNGGDSAYRINTSGGYNTTTVTQGGFYACPCICLSNDLAVRDYSDGYKLAIQG